MSNPAFYGRITIPSGGWQIRVTGSNRTLAAGDYYIASASAAESFVAELQTRIREVDASASVTFFPSGTNKGRITIILTGVNTLTWDGTSSTAVQVRDICGFTANLTAGTTTGAEQAEYTWYPGQPIARALAPLYTLGTRTADAVSTIALDGAVYGTTFQRLRGNVLLFRLVEDNRTWINEEALANESYEKFWQDVVSAFRQVRLKWDDAENVGNNAPFGTTAQYSIVVCGQRTATSMRETVKPHVDSWDARWDIELDLHAWV